MPPSWDRAITTIIIIANTHTKKEDQKEKG